MRFTLVFIYLLASFYTLAQSNEDLYTLTLENIESKKFKKALSNIEKIIKKDNQEKYLLTKVDILYFQNSPPKEVISFLNQHLNDSSSPNLLIERGIGYQSIYRFQDAILDYSEAIKNAKEDSILVKALDYRGSLYQKIRKPKLSKIDYERAYKIDSNSYNICNNFSIVLDDLGDFKRAKYLLLKLVKKDSTSVHAVMNLGYFASLHGEYDEALIYLNKALELEPNGAYALSNISYVKLQLGLTKEALKDVNKSLDLNKGNSYAYKNRALIYIALNKKTEACKDLNTALEYGYSEFFGPEVNELIKTNCIK
jgi:tetratricopeptide (TPR) repeat protein